MAVQGPLRSGSGGVTATALYCYGVVPAKDENSRHDGGLGDAPVEPVRFGVLAALTSPVSSKKVRARRADLLRHFDVLGSAFEDGAVLPMRFGIVFDDEQALVDEFLRPRHDELSGMLRELRDRVELRVSAHYREDAILAEVVRDNPRVGRLREATRGKRGAHPQLLELGELVAAELRTRTARDTRAILDRLGRLAVDHELDEEPIEHQVLRASFLVERKRMPAFDKAMDELASDQAGRIDFKYVGPLPPHSFVSLTHGGRA